MRTFQLTATFDNLGCAFFRAHRKSSMLQLLLNTCKGQRNDPKILDILQTFDLQDLRDRMVKNLSLGEKRRLEIAMAILAEPKVLLLVRGARRTPGPVNVLRQRVGRLTILIVNTRFRTCRTFLTNSRSCMKAASSPTGVRGNYATRKCAQNSQCDATGEQDRTVVA